MTRPLRIAYLASRWDYGNPSRGLSFEETNFRSALEGMGHDVHAYDFVERNSAIGRDPMNRELEAFVRELEPDIAIFVLFKDEIRPETLERLTKSGITTFNWFCDDHWRFDSFSRNYAPHLTLFSTTHPESVERYRAIGCPNVILSQWACNQYVYDRHAEAGEYDVTFIGQRYGDRPKLIGLLRKQGFDVRCWGYGWDDGRLNHERMVQTFGASKVNLNLSNAWAGRWWRKRPPVGQIKARVFEVTGSGGFLLTESVPHLEDYLVPGRELATFQGEDELADKLSYWLSHDEEREFVANAGYERVRREHSYDRRFEEIFAAAALLDR